MILRKLQFVKFFTKKTVNQLNNCHNIQLLYRKNLLCFMFLIHISFEVHCLAGGNKCLRNIAF